MTDGARKRSGVEPTLSRRAFLEGVAGGAFVIGFYVPAAGAGADAKGGVFAPNAFIRIDKSGRITLVMPQVEMGQGIYTAIAMILAEELDAAFEQVSLEAASPSDKLYGNPTFGIQATGNSNSIRAFWMPLRKAAAVVLLSKRDFSPFMMRQTIAGYSRRNRLDLYMNS
jgi:isoquinoline 1-oxidoreductase beta subunit